MITSLLRTILALAGLVVIVFFAIANRGPVGVNLVLLPQAVTVPVYALFLAGLLAGVVLGGIAVWLGGWRVRREGRIAKRRLVSIETRERHEQRKAEEAELAERKARRHQLALTSSDKAA